MPLPGLTPPAGAPDESARRRVQLLGRRSVGVAPGRGAGRDGGRAGLLLLALCRPPAARLPLLRHGPVRRRPGVRAPWPDGARWPALRARLLVRLHLLQRV